MSNQLQTETSPYLIQHKDNPVHWYSWNEEAFQKAKELEKPIFLSIGYSTCHWCHVMAHESFEDEEVAELMNEAFICIKVDREERPDVDGIYMTAIQLLTGSGGWPLNVILTPDKKPFFGGTYFPKESRFGRIGMLDLVPRVSQVWKTDKEKAVSSADSLTEAIKRYSSSDIGVTLDDNIFKSAFGDLLTRFDETYGGFGERPKFPTPHNLAFLLRYWKNTNDDKALKIVTKTLEEMSKGGIWDHIGFGFHRYSTDQQWLLPHFEKMLYDQALLAVAYTEAFQATKNELFRETAEKIFDYVLRDMQSPDGGFYSAEDADSEGEEGKFYVWSIEEIRKILQKDSDNFIKVFNINETGNFFEEATGQRTGSNIPHLKENINELALKLKIEPTALKENIEISRQKLYEEREKRIHPLKDDKVLVDWNGLMIKAFAKAYKVFGVEKYLRAAQSAVNFISKQMQNEDGELNHSFRNNKKTEEAFLDDYAFLVDGLIELYQASFEPRYLKSAIELNNKSIELFWDSEDGGFFMKSQNGEELITRQKEIYDGAIPSGNSVAMSNLLKLALLTGNNELEQKADQLSKAFSKSVENNPSVYTQLLCGLDFALKNPKHIIFSYKEDSKELKEKINELNRKYEPNQLITLITNQTVDELSALNLDIKSKVPVEGKISAYICTNKSCSEPINDISQVI
ncbi:MAG: thioredoxin domain-containing protein [Candidatus Caenarcaniphilales bacterium]|nr:thioredoxin domain-containing protein [Candidatus Caenarcaniphilales bacterium]